MNKVWSLSSPWSAGNSASPSSQFSRAFAPLHFSAGGYRIFLARESAVAKRYVCYLVDWIVVSAREVRIRGNTTALLNTWHKKTM